MQVANLQFKNYPVASVPDLDRMLKSIGADCIIGLDAMLTARRVIIHPDEGFGVLTQQDLKEREYTTLPISFRSSGTLIVIGKYHSDFIPLVIDTGSLYMNLNHHMEGILDIDTAEASNCDDLAIPGSENVFCILDFSFELGETSISVPITFIDKNPSNVGKNKEVDDIEHYGLLGMEALGQFEWIGFDFNKMEMYLGPLREDSYTVQSRKKLN